MAGICWSIQLMMDGRADDDSIFGISFLRIVVIIAMMLSALIGVIRFVKWVWQG
jgi:hypothetical protein